MVQRGGLKLRQVTRAARKGVKGAQKYKVLTNAGKVAGALGAKGTGNLLKDAGSLVGAGKRRRRRRVQRGGKLSVGASLPGGLGFGISF